MAINVGVDCVVDVADVVLNLHTLQVLADILYTLDEVEGSNPELEAYQGEDEFIEDIKALERSLLFEGSDRLVDDFVKVVLLSISVCHE